MATIEERIRFLLDEQGSDKVISKVSRVAKAFRELGIDYIKAVPSKESYRRFKDISKIMTELEKKTRRFKMEWLSVLFFSMAIQRTLQKIGTSAIAEFKRAHEATTFWNTSIGRLQIAFTMMRIAIGEALNRALRPFADWLTENLDMILELVSKDQIIKFGIKTFTAASLAMALSTAILGVSGLSQIAGKTGVEGLMMYIGIGFAIYKIFDVAEDLMEGEFGQALIDAIGAGAGLALATGNWKAAGALFMVGMGLNLLAEVFADEGINTKEKFKMLIAAALQLAGSAVFIANPIAGAALFAIGFSLQLVSVEAMEEARKDFDQWIRDTLGLTKLIERHRSGGDELEGQFGRFIPSTGLYKLHAGEIVTNPSFSSSVTVHTGPISSSVDVTGLANTVSNIVMRDIKRYTQPVGRYG